MTFPVCDRYGLPVNFQAMLLHPHKKNTKRLRDVLNQLYGHLDSSAVQGSSAHDVGIVSNRMVIESKGLTLLISKPPTGHNPLPLSLNSIFK
jgi:hypothetical protein